MKYLKGWVVVGVGLLWAVLPSGADVKLPALFSDNMVLQRDRVVPVWGTAGAGEQVTVTLGEAQATTTANQEGQWRVQLPAQPAGGPFELTVAGKNTLTLHNVLIGEVWIASGQSNMEWPVSLSLHPEQEIAAANYPQIRLFGVKHTVASQPRQDTEGTWVECTPQTVAGFSAVAYFFGRDLHQALGVPVGLIKTAWGGTPAESWISRPTLEAHPDLKGLVERWDAVRLQALEDYVGAVDQYFQQVARWVQNAQSSGLLTPMPAAPGLPGILQNPWRASGLYNGMIAPLIPYALRGAIWYQGESNANRAYQYRTLFPALIQDWRRAWGQGDFPFLFVQLANFTAPPAEPGESDWAELREAQSMALALPNTGMAVAIDLGEADNIHPPNKQEVGRRLALAARAIAYGQPVVYSGPLYQSMAVEGHSIRLWFRHLGGGLVAQGGGPLRGFAIAGADRKFVWAEARIEGETVVVHSDQVPQPVAVRYAWANNPEGCNLFNQAGLPASPFRTDDWPGVTVNNR
jgi:sialate O-acetylesterase